MSNPIKSEEIPRSEREDVKNFRANAFKGYNDIVGSPLYYRRLHTGKTRKSQTTETDPVIKEEPGSDGEEILVIDKGKWEQSRKTSAKGGEVRKEGNDGLPDPKARRNDFWSVALN
ncbi:hypothetical protein MMC20_006210 [Loxospora ochrophaea]|nr:hypothetical protein [Loxospora ochrophaea]